MKDHLHLFVPRNCINIIYKHFIHYCTLWFIMVRWWKEMWTIPSSQIIMLYNIHAYINSLVLPLIIWILLLIINNLILHMVAYFQTISLLWTIIAEEADKLEFFHIASKIFLHKFITISNFNFSPKSGILRKCKMIILSMHNEWSYHIS